MQKSFREKRRRKVESLLIYELDVGALPNVK